MNEYEKKDPIILSYSKDIRLTCVLFKCPYCGELFDSWDILFQELITGTNNYCPECKKEFL